MKSCQLFLFAVLSITLSLAGCGYTNKTVLPRDLKTIYVKTVRNEIPIEALYAYQPGLEMAITNAIIQRFQVDGILKVVKEDEADAILDASLIGFEQEGVRFSNLESVEEYRLFIILKMKLIDGKTNEKIWEEPSFSGDAEYFVTDVNAVSREAASQKAIERLAFNVVDRVVEDW